MGTTEAHCAEVSFACLPEGTQVSFSPDIRLQEGPRGKPCTLSDSQAQHLTLSRLLWPQTPGWLRPPCHLLAPGLEEPILVSCD